MQFLVDLKWCWVSVARSRNRAGIGHPPLKHCCARHFAITSLHRTDPVVYRAQHLLCSTLHCPGMGHLGMQRVRCCKHVPQSRHLNAIVWDFVWTRTNRDTHRLVPETSFCTNGKSSSKITGRREKRKTKEEKRTFFFNKKNELRLLPSDPLRSPPSASLLSGQDDVIVYGVFSSFAFPTAMSAPES